MHRQKGFSLVELSIVLVILGLLTGGILGGQSLIHAAELRSVSKEMEQWTTAVNTFKDKYFALPGDMNNAIQFWGNADDGTYAGECSDNGQDAGTGTQTCNGNGDGIVAFDDSDEYYELFRFWQHLSNAGLITGNYSGTEGSGGDYDAVVGVNVPRSKFKGGGWATDNVGYPFSAGYTWLFDIDYGQGMFLGSAVSGGPPYGPLFTPEEAWNLDTKMDDGRPGTGSMKAIWWDDCSDAVADTDADTANYLLSETGSVCTISFTNPF